MLPQVQVETMLRKRHFATYVFNAEEGQRRIAGYSILRKREREGALGEYTEEESEQASVLKMHRERERVEAAK